MNSTKHWEALLKIASCLATLAAAASAQTHLEVQALGALLGDSTSAIRLAQPLGMSVDLEDNIYIADTGNHRVLKCNLQGELLREVGGFGFGEQQFDRPVEVWAGNGLDVLVADYNNQRLQRYDKDLNFISSYSSNETLGESLRFGYPAAAALSAQGELFVADHEFNRVLRFDAFGSPKASFGDFNWGEGRLERPAKIFISRRNEVWVSDSLRPAIIVYDTFGNFVRRVSASELAAPCGMAEWPPGMIVTDSKQHALIFFNAEGERLGTFGKPGKGLGKFDAPTAVMVLRRANAKSHETSRVLVLESGNNRVQLLGVKWRL